MPNTGDHKTSDMTAGAGRQALSLLRKLMEVGQWFGSAIELDSHDTAVDGEQLHADAQKILSLPPETCSACRHWVNNSSDVLDTTMRQYEHGGRWGFCGFKGDTNGTRVAVATVDPNGGRQRLVPVQAPVYLRTRDDFGCFAFEGVQGGDGESKEQVNA